MLDEIELLRDVRTAVKQIEDGQVLTNRQAKADVGDSAILAECSGYCGRRRRASAGLASITADPLLQQEIQKRFGGYAASRCGGSKFPGQETVHRKINCGRLRVQLEFDRNRFVPPIGKAMSIPVSLSSS
jgi:hypothetical protein